MCETLKSHRHLLPLKQHLSYYNDFVSYKLVSDRNAIVNRFNGYRNVVGAGGIDQQVLAYLIQSVQSIAERSLLTASSRLQINRN